MKTRFSLFGFIAILLLGIGMYFASCNNNDTNGVVTYKGHVVYLKTTTPFPDLEVKVTNGDKIHALTHTDAEGAFSLKVNVSEIDGSYFVLVGDSTCVTKKVDLSGYGQAEVDLGTIEIEGPSAPVVETKPISDVSDNKATCGGNVTSDGRSFVTARGVCWSKSEYPTIDDDHTTNGTGLGEFKSQLTNLEAGATYFVRAYATNRMGTSYGQQVSTATATGLPQVTTDEVTNIFATSATCGGDVAANSGYSITARGICWSDKTATPTINDAHTSEVATTGHFTSLMIGLERNTSYYVRAYAVNEKGANYGNAVTFTTLTGLPTVTTSQVTNIKASSATCGGNVTDNGGYAITARGVCWSKTSSTPSIQDSHTSEVADNGAFSSLMTNLEPASTYYVRAYATNSIGTGYGDVLAITTGNGLPIVETTTPTLANDSTILTGGNIIDDGEYPIISRGICYGQLPYPDLTNNYNHTTNGNGSGYFSSTFSIAVNSGVYYIRAYATNANGTSYGNQLIIDRDYMALPTFLYNGHTYKVAPDPGGYISWDAANSYCDNLTLYGYDDWRMPTIEELETMYRLRSSINGFAYDYQYQYGTTSNHNNVYRYMYYLSSTTSGDKHACIRWKDGARKDTNQFNTNGRFYLGYLLYYSLYYEQYEDAHIRPIRVEQ